MKNDLGILIQHYEEKIAAMEEEQRIYVNLGEYREAGYFSTAIAKMEEELRLLRSLYDSNADTREEILQQINQTRSIVGRSENIRRKDFFENRLARLEMDLAELKLLANSRWGDNQFLYDNLQSLMRREISSIEMVLIAKDDIRFVFTMEATTKNIIVEIKGRFSHRYRTNMDWDIALRKLGFRQEDRSFTLLFAERDGMLDEAIIILSRLVYGVFGGEVDEDVVLFVK